MWIRSQNKRLLINTDVISVDDYCDYYVICGGGYELGRYYSKEKALKVLSEIQNIKYLYHKAFEMPADDEVKENE